MALSDIADGLEVTREQRDRGVATVDGTAVDLREALDRFGDDLPCAPAAATTVVEHHATGGSIGESARAAGIAPITAAKALYLLGEEGISPLTPTGRAIVRDWLSGELSRADAEALTGATEAEFALAAFVETHEPLDGAREAVEGALSRDADAAVRKRDRLAETMSDVGELR